MLDAGRPLSTWVAAAIDADAAQWMREAADRIEALTRENASLCAECGMRQIRGYNEGKRAVERELEQARAEIGVLLNSAEMIANAALPTFEGWDYKSPDHGTGELVTAAKGFQRQRTNATNECAVAWMRDMTLRADAAEARAEANAKDAARYLWLRRSGHEDKWLNEVRRSFYEGFATGHNLDAAIDAGAKEGEG